MAGENKVAATHHIDQATPEEIGWIAELEARVYDSEDAIPNHILKEWYSSNPTGFSVIKLKDGQKIGHIDILPLRPAPLHLFLEGTIRERDIRANDLYPPSERASIRNLYIESIIVLPQPEHSNTSAVLFLLSNFIPLIKRICDLANVENVYAIAASISGERIMKHLGFIQIKSARDRTDQHNLFVAKFVELASRISKFCDKRLHR